MSEDDDIDEPPSKSLRKRQSTDLQALGEALIDLPISEFEALPLPENLRDAVELARRITAHGGLYRQKQYIGKLMRKIDSEPIRVAMAARQTRERVAAMRFRRVEQWRDRLMAEGPAALDELSAELGPTIDLSAIRKTMEHARIEHASGRPPHSARELFRKLREILLTDDTK